MNKKLKRTLYQIIAALFLFAASWLPLPQYIVLSLLAASFLIAGSPVIAKALRNIRRGQVFDENFLMTVATFGAIVLGEYAEAAAVMLFYQVGEFFQSYAVNRSRKSIAALMDIRPDYARVIRGGKAETVSPDEVEIGEVIEIRSGEKVPLDGIIIKGQSSLNTAALTGESLPQDAGEGQNVISGSVNLTGVLQVKTTKLFAESTVAKILELVENAASQKASLENFITKFARYYTPAVVGVALALFLLPPLLLGGQTFGDWGYRAITFLVISCPCALVISIPLSFFGGIGAASKCGILIKGGNYLEALADAETVVFDKTGTLTEGNFVVAEITSETMPKNELLELAAHIEAYSTHPIAASIRQAYGKKPDLRRISDVKEIFGKGITAVFDGVKVAAGNAKMLAEYGIALPLAQTAGTEVHIVCDNQYAGCLNIEDEIKPDAAAAVAELKKLGVRQTVMLTGDRKETAQKVAEALKLDKFYAGLLPADKVAKIEELLKNKTQKGRLLFAGDGINDAPVLARSDIGIAMGGVGSDAAVEAADVVIMTDEPSKIASAIRISRKTLRIAKENIVFALGVKFLVLGLGAAGFASIWAAVFADVGVSVIAILNAVRALRLHKQC